MSVKVISLGTLTDVQSVQVHSTADSLVCGVLPTLRHYTAKTSEFLRQHLPPRMMMCSGCKRHRFSAV